MGWDLLLYVIGLLAGVLLSFVWEAQLRRPGIRQGVGLVIFVFAVWATLSVTHTQLISVLLPLIWAVTGLLVGFGSRETEAA